MKARKENDRLYRFKFEKYQPEKEKIYDYITRFEFACKMHKIKCRINKKSLLLHNIGGEVFNLINDSFGGQCLKRSFSLGTIYEFLFKHFSSNSDFLRERFKFHNLERKGFQSFISYASELRRAGKKCGFGNSLDERLRDQFLAGLKHSGTQEKLFSIIENKNISYSEVLEIALSIEIEELKILNMKMNKEKTGDSFDLINENGKIMCIGNTENGEIFDCKSCENIFVIPDVWVSEDENQSDSNFYDDEECFFTN